MTRTLLSVNLNKVALIRNSRGGNLPDLVAFARDCERFGAQGITVHPRPDERHTRRADLAPLKAAVNVEFNIEGYPSPDFLDIVCEVRPAQCTLVPDPPGALTSDAGWNVAAHRSLLSDAIGRLKAAGIRVSIFMEASPDGMADAAAVGADRIELYTGPYAEHFPQGAAAAVAPYIIAAEAAQAAGLGVNAGHDLNLYNLRYFVTHVPGVLEVSIGHALISDALYMGIERTIAAYRLALAG